LTGTTVEHLPNFEVGRFMNRMTGLLPHVAVLAVFAGSAFAYFSYVDPQSGLSAGNERAALAARVQQASIIRAPFWQLAHPSRGSCALASEPAAEKTPFAMSESCRNLFVDLVDAAYWQRESEDRVVLMAADEKPVMAFTAFDAALFEADSGSDSQTQLIPPLL
jgi:hypothetical protein